MLGARRAGRKPGQGVATMGGRGHHAGVERIGPYEVLELLARGGMGVVLRARDLRDGRLVALKVPSGDVGSNEAQRTRFLREIEALRRLDHPHVVRVLDSGVADGRLFVAMELVEGPSLALHLAGRSGPLAPGEAAELVRKLARAADHAHQHGVLHRDRAAQAR